MEVLIRLIAAVLAVIDQGVDDEAEDEDQKHRGDGHGQHVDVIDLLGHAGRGLGEIDPQLGGGGTGPGRDGCEDGRGANAL